MDRGPARLHIRMWLTLTTAWSRGPWPSCPNAPPIDNYALAAEKNLDWVLSHFRPSGWIDGINLPGHPNYLHFIAYVLQGALECGILRRRSDAIEAVAKSAWVLLRKFETNKFLPGAYDADFKNGQRFTCLTGNAQMSCVWLRLFELTDDLRYLNAALKMNEMLKELIPARGRRGNLGRSERILPHLGPLSASALHQLGMQILRGRSCCWNSA